MVPRSDPPRRRQIGTAFHQNRCEATYLGFAFIVLRTLARLRADALNLIDAFADSLLYPLISGMVISTVVQIVGETLHVSHFICEIVSVSIALTITQALHYSGG